MAWLGFLWLAPEPGSSEDVFARIHVGMSRDEALAILRSYSPGTTEGHYSAGRTKNGRAMGRLHVEQPAFENLPPLEEIEFCVLKVEDKDGREVEVLLGSDGTVFRKRLLPGVWEDRASKIHWTLARTRDDLLSGLWWRDQAHKVYRSLRRNGITSRWIWLPGLLLMTVWTLRRGRVRRLLNVGHPVTRQMVHDSSHRVG